MHALKSRTSASASAVPEPAPSGTRAKALDTSALRRAMLETGTSEESLARRMGRSRALVRKWEDGEGLSVERVAAVAAASPRLGVALLGVLRAQLDALGGERAEEPSEAVPRLAVELGDVSKVFLAAIADGQWSRDELLDFDRELADVEELVRSYRRGVAGRLG